jgi:hypothetical protein
MGMAASQARYLGLTARKTNTEYEGQQVNQQRTALANQSANLFSQLMALNVPTPPSTEEFTTLQYTYNDGFNNETITSTTPLTTDPDYNYTVTHQHTESVYQGIQYVKTNPAVTQVAGENWVNNLRTTPYNATTDLQAVTQIATDYPTSNLSAAFNSTGGHTPAELYSYKSAGQTYFTCQQDMDASRTSGTVPQAALDLYYAASLDEQITTTERGYIQTDSSGRMSAIELESTPTTEFPLTTTQTTDTNAYNDAMNQYTYNTQLYEKSIEDINSQTALIQQEDRELELRLKQLDTEQEALQTEMDSVKKVIDKNIETTFKTFS